MRRFLPEMPKVLTVGRSIEMLAAEPFVTHELDLTAAITVVEQTVLLSLMFWRVFKKVLETDAV